MIHYEIDYYFEGAWRHTCSDSSFPTDTDFKSGDYTEEGLQLQAYTLVCSVLKMEHKRGFIDKDRIHYSCTLIPSEPTFDIFEEYDAGRIN